MSAHVATNPVKHVKLGRFCHDVYIFREYTKIVKRRYKDSSNSTLFLLCPPFKKDGHIALHMSVGMSVGRSVGMSVCRYPLTLCN